MRARRTISLNGHMVPLLCLSALLASACAAPAAAQEAPGKTPQDMAIARKLVGVWRLASRMVTFADGTSRPDPRTTAYLIYSDTGMACYVAMDPTRVAWKSEAAPTAEEALAGITGLGAYCGTFRVDAAAGSVVHTMEIERIPNLVGRDRRRLFTFDGDDRLILVIGSEEYRPPVVERRLLWERVKARPELREKAKD
jgi:hypothetical protein